MKHSFFQAMVVSILLYGCTTSTLTKRMEKKLDSNCTRMLRAILNKSWRQHPTKQQLYDHQTSIMKTIKIRWTRHAGHCWKSKDKLKSDVLLWNPSHGWAKAGWPARTYIQQLCPDKGCSPGDLPEAMGGERGLGISMLIAWHDDDGYCKFFKKFNKFEKSIELLKFLFYHIYQPLHSGRIWHKVIF